ncbi:GNAT family N-acetyltransferase [Candidatus Bathyarchaeota archaeon]|nr:GNAT family N-acetyltransferase [Candidatus Bathyarchaeota archaeon]
MTEFQKVEDTDSAEFTQALTLYSESIPASERQTVETIKERIRSGKEELYIASIDHRVASMALLYSLEDTQFVLLDYLAVKETYRKRGLGSEFLRNVYEIAGLKNKLIICEVEDPKTGADKEARQRRVYFYRKNGARILKNVRYMLPPLQGSKHNEMILMVISSNRRLLWLSGDAIKEVVAQIYRELYGRGETDPLLVSTLKSIEPQITLQ